MKDCEGCRFLVKGRFELGQQDLEFCVAAPPAPMFITRTDERGQTTLTLEAYYPPRPQWRCAMYKRRGWFSRS